MKLKTLCALLLLGSGSAPAAYAFEESPALPERLIPGGQDRQRALPEQFKAIATPVWAFDVGVAPVGTSEPIAARQTGFPAAQGRLACLQALLDSGIAADLPDRTGLTELYWARRNNQVLAESLFIAQGASREAWPIPER